MRLLGGYGETHCGKSHILLPKILFNRSKYPTKHVIQIGNDKFSHMTSTVSNIVNFLTHLRVETIHCVPPVFGPQNRSNDTVWAIIFSMFLTTSESNTFCLHISPTMKTVTITLKDKKTKNSILLSYSIWISKLVMSSSCMPRLLINQLKCLGNW